MGPKPGRNGVPNRCAHSMRSAAQCCPQVAPHFYQSKERGETAGSICAGVHLRVGAAEDV